jgi:HlyD family secretion protein
VRSCGNPQLFTHDHGKYESVRRPVGALAAAALAMSVLAGCTSGDDGDVVLGTVGRSTVTEVVEAPATVSARATAEVTAAADGRVARLPVREGQRVRAGRLLVRLDSPQAQRGLRAARQADAEAASAGDIVVPSTGLSEAGVQADARARRAFMRARESARRIPDRQLRRQALSAVDASAAQYSAASAQAQDAVRRFEAGIGSLADALSSLSAAQRVQTRAAVLAAERTVAALVVRAPISGTVSLSGGDGSSTQTDPQGLVDQLPQSLQDQAGQLLGGSSAGTVTGTLAAGQPVRAGQTLMTVTDASELSLTAQVDETDVLLVERGVEATAELDAVPDAAYPATVTTIDPRPTASSRGGVTYIVRLALAIGTLADGTIAPVPRPGMSAVVDLRVRTAPDAVAVPAPAVFRDGRRDAVWVVKNDTARKRLVRVGAQGQDRVQVLEGLAEGERVVVRGADRVTDGQRLS